MTKPKTTRKILLFFMLMMLSIIAVLTGCGKEKSEKKEEDTSVSIDASTDDSSQRGEEDTSASTDASTDDSSQRGEEDTSASTDASTEDSSQSRQEDTSASTDASTDTSTDDSSQGGEDDPVSKDPITLNVFSERASYSGEQMGWFAKVLLDKYNVKLNIIPNGSGVFETRMESGYLGDIVVFGSENDYTKARDAGLLLDWEKNDMLADHGSYMLANCSKALEKNREMSSDGKIYGIGYEVATSDADVQSFFYTWDIRWDLYEQLGHPRVKNLDDYLNLMLDMKKLCPTDEDGNHTYAFSLWPDWDGDLVMYVKSTVTAYYGYDEFGVGHYDPVTGKFYGALDDGSPYLEMLEFYHKLYMNDLLDPDSMTATYDDVIEKVKKGGVFSSIFNYTGSLAYNTDDHLGENKIMRSLTPEDASPIAYGLNVYGGNNYWAIGANSEYADICMEIINYMYTPEGRLTIEYGPKGITWDYNDQGGLYLTELGKKTNDDRFTAMEGEGYEGYTFNDGLCQINMTSWSLDAVNLDSGLDPKETYNDEYWVSEQAEPKNDADKDWRDFTGATSVNEYMKKGKYTVAPSSKYVSSNKSDEFKTTWSQVTKCITEYSWKAIYAEDDEKFESIVKAMKSKADNYGYDECRKWCEEEAAKRYEAEQAGK